MGQFDQTARPLSKLGGRAFFDWGLSCSAPGMRLSFVQWDDTRRLVIPGEPDRTNDLVAQMRDESRGGRPVWLIGEIEEEPEKGILYRLGQYEFLLGKEVNPACDPKGPLVGCVLINLTGEQMVRRLDSSWMGTDLGTKLAPFIVDVANEDAALTLAKIESREFGLPILPYIVLMRGGSKPELIERWPKVAEMELDIARRVYYRDAALVFAELTQGSVNWLKVLEGWQMRESQYIKRWERVGEERGILLTKREALLEAVKLRLENPVPEPIRLAIEGTNDLTTLDRWYRAALTSDSVTEFRKALQLTP